MAASSSLEERWAALVPPSPDTTLKFDLIVIGGGSGGVACAREAASLGAKVAIIDHVDPSPQGTVYGLGGTCVNVGCIPKKLMHYAGLLSGHIADANEYGWDVPATKPAHDWDKLRELVQDYIGQLVISYVSGFREDPQTTYFNAKGKFIDANTVWARNLLGGRRAINKLLTAPHIVVAVGGRPHYPALPGAREFCHSSDDLFSLQQRPGKTLVIGAAYIALECGGFLHELGYEVTIMVRSIFLRGFDQEIAERIGKFMEDTGVRFLRPSNPRSFAKNEAGRIVVTYDVDGVEQQDDFDTVILAVGRDLVTPALDLQAAGVEVAADGSIKCDDHQRSNIQHIYAIGDILHGCPQLTPVAIKTGRLLSQRLFGGSKQLMNFKNIATTVFTPIEYGVIGLSEEAAIQQYGEDNIEVFHNSFNPLEWSPGQGGGRPKYSGYLKLVCLIPEDNRVLGFHYLGPNAGEVTQGFSTAMHLGATKAHFDLTVGIHPSCAESLTTLKITKRSGVELQTGGCAT